MDLLSKANWVYIGVILAVGALLWLAAGRLARALKRRLIVDEVDTEGEKRATTLIRMLRLLFAWVLAVVVLMLVLSELDVTIAPLLGLAGVASIAAGLGAQTLAKDFLRGFVLLADNQIRVGDLVEIAGKSGRIEQINLRTVTLRSYDGAIHFIPAGEIQVVTNRSHGHAYAVLDVGIAEDVEVDRAVQAMREAAAALQAEPGYAKRILAPIEVAGIERWGDDAVLLRARIRTQPGQNDPVRRELLRRIKQRFEHDGIRSPTQRLAVRLDRSPSGSRGGGASTPRDP